MDITNLQDVKMIQRAFEQRWPITDVYRQELVRKLMRIALDPNIKTRESIAAAKALIVADAQNIEMERIAQADEHEFRANLVAIAKHLGPSQIARLAIDAGVSIEQTELASFGNREATEVNGGEKG